MVREIKDLIVAYADDSVCGLCLVGRDEGFIWGFTLITDSYMCHKTWILKSSFYFMTHSNLFAIINTTYVL